MAYEVTKVVRGRKYRYRVRSERDPESGKFRNRWTYLGRADAQAEPLPVRARGNARGALLDALERLLDRDDPATVTAAEVSAAAGFAHGTFYRHFRNKSDAMTALLDRVRTEKDVEAAALDEPPRTAADARRTLRAWASARLRAPIAHRGFIRALFILRSHDPTLQRAEVELRTALVQRLGRFLRVCSERGYARVGDPDVLASVLPAMVSGILRNAVAGEHDAAVAAEAVDAIERVVFGRLD